MAVCELPRRCLMMKAGCMAVLPAFATSRTQEAEHARAESMRQTGRKGVGKSRFLAAAGHDLRQPLAAANLFIDALKSTATTSNQNKIIKRLDQAMSNFNGCWIHCSMCPNLSRHDSAELIPINVADMFSWLERSLAPLATRNGLDSDCTSRLSMRLSFAVIWLVQVGVDEYCFQCDQIHIERGCPD